MQSHALLTWKSNPVALMTAEERRMSLRTHLYVRADGDGGLDDLHMYMVAQIEDLTQPNLFICLQGTFDVQVLDGPLNNGPHVIHVHCHNG